MSHDGSRWGISRAGPSADRGKGESRTGTFEGISGDPLTDPHFAVPLPDAFDMSVSVRLGFFWLFFFGFFGIVGMGPGAQEGGLVGVRLDVRGHEAESSEEVCRGGVWETGGRELMRTGD